jgi:ADP-heptose:LPS heptosyltransferase
MEIGDLIDLEYEKRDHKGFEIHQWDHATLTDNYDDTAGLVAELDYVVTVCTAIVHLAGGLGVPTYVLKPACPSWRYNPETFPWYNSVELIPYENSWENSIESVKNTLQKQRKAA